VTRAQRGPGRALLIKCFFAIDATAADHTMPAPGSTAYFELAIEHILREIAKLEVRTRYELRILRPWRTWQLRKLRNRMCTLLDLADAQYTLAAIRSRPSADSTRPEP